MITAHISQVPKASGYKTPAIIEVCFEDECG